MELSKLIVDTKNVWMEYPGLDKFEVQVAALSRKELQNLRKRCVVSKFNKKTHQPEEELNEEKFLDEFTKAVIKDWKGLKFKYLDHLMLVDISQVDPEAFLEYSEANAKLLVANSSEFDTWLNEAVFDLDNFRSESKGTAVGTAGKVAQ